MHKIAVLLAIPAVVIICLLAILATKHEGDVPVYDASIISDITQRTFERPTIASLSSDAIYDLPEKDRADLALFALRKELPRLGFPTNTNLDHVRQFVFMVKEAESAGDRYATSTANAMSFYQFKPDSVITAVNRFENWSRRHELIFPSWADDLRDSPESIYELPESLQALLMMVNIIQQEGSDANLIELIAGETEAAKELYYVNHHTNPDDRTIDLIERVFQEHFSL